MKRDGNNSEPIKLEIEDLTYYYGEDELFKQLEKYINFKINVIYEGEDIKHYIIKTILDVGGIPQLELE